MGLLQRANDASMAFDIGPLPDEQRRGLIAIVITASLSIVATTSLLCFLTHRMIFWRGKYARYIGYNQNVILIYNLILADLQQSIGFLLSAKWAAQNKIVTASPVCYAQGIFLQIGDPGSGMFVFAIAVHTFYMVSMGRKLSYRVFVGCVVSLWCFIALLTVLPPALFGRDAFVPSGSWVCDSHPDTLRPRVRVSD